MVIYSNSSMVVGDTRTQSNVQFRVSFQPPTSFQRQHKPLVLKHFKARPSLKSETGRPAEEPQQRVLGTQSSGHCRFRALPVVEWKDIGEIPCSISLAPAAVCSARVTRDLVGTRRATSNHERTPEHKVRRHKPLG
jgi:hypothetical protein